MIERFVFRLQSEHQLYCGHAYALYAWLLEQASCSLGKELHLQGEHPISQYLEVDRCKGEIFWRVSLLSQECIQAFIPVLEKASTIALHLGEIHAELLTHEQVESGEQFIRKVSDHKVEPRACLHFLSPVSFKQDRRYVIFPQERLVIKNLLNKWNCIFPEYLLDDSDAFQALERGLHIVDYRLQSVRFRLKNNGIPSCQGNIVMESRLAAPMFEIWNALIRLGEYAGLGIKTTLGMGGLQVAKSSGG